MEPIHIVVPELERHMTGPRPETSLIPALATLDLQAIAKILAPKVGLVYSDLAGLPESELIGILSQQMKLGVSQSESSDDSYESSDMFLDRVAILQTSSMRTGQPTAETASVGLASTIDQDDFDLPTQLPWVGRTHYGQGQITEPGLTPEVMDREAIMSIVGNGTIAQFRPKQAGAASYPFRKVASHHAYDDAIATYGHKTWSTWSGKNSRIPTWSSIYNTASGQNGKIQSRGRYHDFYFTLPFLVTPDMLTALMMAISVIESDISHYIPRTSNRSGYDLSRETYLDWAGQNAVPPVPGVKVVRAGAAAGNGIYAAGLTQIIYPVIYTGTEIKVSGALERVKELRQNIYIGTSALIEKMSRLWLADATRERLQWMRSSLKSNKDIYKSSFGRPNESWSSDHEDLWNSVSSLYANIHEYNQASLDMFVEFPSNFRGKILFEAVASYNGEQGGSKYWQHRMFGYARAAFDLLPHMAVALSTITGRPRTWVGSGYTSEFTSGNSTDWDGLVEYGRDQHVFHTKQITDSERAEWDFPESIQGYVRSK